MPVVKPPPSRSKIEDDGTLLRILTPQSQYWPAILFQFLWLIPWGMFEILAWVISAPILTQLWTLIIEGNMSAVIHFFFSGSPIVFVVIWFILWTIGGPSTIYSLIWRLTTKESIEFSSESIKIKRGMIGFGRSREYWTTRLKALRAREVGHSFLSSWISGRDYLKMPDGNLMFDYGSKTIRFGLGIDEAEAKQIVEKTLTRFPQYAPGKTAMAS